MKKLSTVLFLFLFATSCFAQFFYDNKASSWLFSEDGQKKELAFHLSNHDSIVGVYGMDGYISSAAKKTWVQKWVARCYDAGIKNSFIWSDDKSVTVGLASYQRSQSTDKTRFARCRSELEPYNNSLSYAEFDRRCAAVNSYCHSNPVKILISEIYMGWPSTWKAIIKNCDLISLHCYISYDKMSSGISQYFYTGSRLEVLSSEMDQVYPLMPLMKKDVQIIHSNESTFAKKYFVSNSYDKGYAVYQSGFALNASPKVKRRINLRGRADFVSGNDPHLYPSGVMRMAIPSDEPHMPKLLIAYPDGTNILVDQKPLETN